MQIANEASRGNKSRVRGGIQTDQEGREKRDKKGWIDDGCRDKMNSGCEG